MGLDTTFLAQLEIQEAEAHDTALEVARRTHGTAPFLVRCRAGRGRRRSRCAESPSDRAGGRRPRSAPRSPPEAVMVGGSAVPYRIGGLER